jgi:hypothetical protein
MARSRDAPRSFSGLRLLGVEVENELQTLERQIQVHMGKYCGLLSDGGREPTSRHNCGVGGVHLLPVEIYHVLDHPGVTKDKP